ncbi:MAG TPA: glycosyltransferase [Acidobacteriota bacterium]|nr:glycosyltransferase [Acidobacteriota bacterium]HQF88580.1 glycosyltransferase [Acidobacteriota bacterium]HQG93143.1 glycosyltransferase [Acidobacteriota bacterium]
MNRWTVAIRVDDPAAAAAAAAAWAEREWVARVALLVPVEAAESLPPGVPADVRRVPAFLPGRELERLISDMAGEYLALVEEPVAAAPEAGFPERLVAAFEHLGAGCLYSHWRREAPDGAVETVFAPPFQPGSARDTFPWGPLTAWRRKAVAAALDAEGPLAPTRWSGLAELRLRLARAGAVARVPEPLYRVRPPAGPSTDRHFEYLMHEHRDRQAELETVFTEHLRRTGAWLPPPAAPLPPTGEFPVLASVVIPVRNRARTIGEAVESAASQRVDFPFNVLVVDNHSTDGTGAVVEAARRRHAYVHRLVPPLPGRGIGGCWGLAVESPLCGRYAVQLDSDDLYAGPDTLQRMVEGLRAGGAALAVGSYRLVDRDLNELPPGVIDHREWTPANGHNNLLRVEGIGAPRAYHVPALRRVGFPDVSYGEDYAAALGLSRIWPVARIFEPVYLCRRWEGNTDSGLTSLQQALHHEYKDYVRTLELAARRKMAGSEE